MAIIVNETHNVRTTQDDMNPRIYLTEYKCAACGAWNSEDDTVWIPDGSGLAYCVDCAPEQDDY
jgi:hypothetical protein